MAPHVARFCSAGKPELPGSGARGKYWHAMKSNKQKRTELAARKARQKDKHKDADHAQIALRPGVLDGEAVRVNVEALAPHNSYGEPDFVTRGLYAPRPFTCRDCGVDEVWTPRQQKWWYEVAKGYVFATATRCRACRRRERDRRAAARKAHLDGLARKTQPK